MKKNNKELIAEVTFLLALKRGNVSIKEIQNASGLSAGSIYYHFKDKNEILFHMVNVYLIDNFHEYRDSIRNSNDSFIEKIENIFYYLLGFNKKEFNSSHSSAMSEFDFKDYFSLFSSIFHQYPEIRPIFHKLHTESYIFYQEVVQEAIENKEIKDSIDNKELTIFIHTIFKGYIDLCVFHPDLSIEELVNANLTMIKELTKK